MGRMLRALDRASRSLRPGTGSSWREALASAALVLSLAVAVQGCACDCGCDKPARPPKPVARDASRDPVGTTFTFKDTAAHTTLEVEWLAADRISWLEWHPESSDGETPPPERGEATVAVSELRRGASFVRWRDERGTARLQVVDLGAGLAATTTVSADLTAQSGRATVSPKAGPAPTAGSPTDLTGRTFTLDLGAGAATRVAFAAGGKLAWEELRGAATGQRGEAAIESAEVRPGLLFVRWRQDGRLVAAVLDLDLRRVVRTVVTGAGLEHAEGALLDADS